MPKYNIIYTSSNDTPYLWNGTLLFELEKEEQEVLKFSGSSFKKEELKEAIEECKAAIAEMFPTENNPKIKTVEITVSD